jgi:hypothetical protein
VTERYLVNSVQFDEDGVVSITYMDREDALRESGNLFRTQTLSVAPGSALWADLDDILVLVKDFLVDADQLYRNQPPWLPSEVEDEEEDEDRGMGY